jgi:hypothetical protein
MVLEMRAGITRTAFLLRARLQFVVVVVLVRRHRFLASFAQEGADQRSCELGQPRTDFPARPSMSNSGFRRPGNDPHRPRVRYE